MIIRLSSSILKPPILSQSGDHLPTKLDGMTFLCVSPSGSMMCVEAIEQPIFMTETSKNASFTIILIDNQTPLKNLESDVDQKLHQPLASRISHSSLEPVPLFLLADHIDQAEDLPIPSCSFFNCLSQRLLSKSIVSYLSQADVRLDDWLLFIFCRVALIQTFERVLTQNPASDVTLFIVEYSFQPSGLPIEHLNLISCY